jgi:AAA family ATP:ADP antiporter
VDVRDHEIRALLWSFGYFFCLLCSYTILRPLRDEMGIAGGVGNLPWLFTATFVAMLFAVPLFGAMVARFPRRRFVPLTYRLFIACIIVFFVVLSMADDRVHVGRVFFVWVSLFNLFIVSVFWSFMADIFRNAQGRRLFGFIAAGGSAGALLGPAITIGLAVPLGPVNLLLVSALFLEAAVRCIHRLLHAPEASGNGPPVAAPGTPPDEAAIGGGLLAGITQVARSPYLLGICLYLVLYTTTSTFLYFQQADIIAGGFDDPAERTRIFAVIDFSVALITILAQCFVTGRAIRWAGVGAALAVLPVLTMAGFATLAAAPALGVLIAFQALRRATNFAISRPAREILYTVVSREQKYKSKNFIDTAVYRGGDAASGWAFAGLKGLGLDLAAIAAVAVPLAALWMAVALLLGRRQEQLVAAAAGRG